MLLRGGSFLKHTLLLSKHDLENEPYGAENTYEDEYLMHGDSEELSTANPLMHAAQLIASQNGNVKRDDDYGYAYDICA